MHIYDFFGSAVCHQMAERSFYIAGIQTPLCARCTGIEAGFLFGWLFLLLCRRTKGNQPFSLAGILLAACCFIPIGIDGGGSYIGLLESNNFRRVVTGSLAGVGLPALFLLVANFQPQAQNQTPIYRNIWEQVGLLLFTLLYGLAVYFGYLPYTLVAVVSMLGVICFYGSFWFLVVRLLTINKKFPCIWTAFAGGLLTASLVAICMHMIKGV